jgi:UDP:flavonoid glycosyltransferase YjiC (YdhE family)
MAHFGVVAPAFYSHFNALQALAVVLIERGHQVTFLQRPDAAVWLTDRRIGFYAVGGASHPPGSLAASLRRAARPGSLPGLHRVITDMARLTDMLCNELPAALAALRIDAVLGDQMEAAAGLVAEALALPCISVACALPVNREAGMPLPVMPFAFGRDPRSLRICEGSTRVYDWLMTPHRRSIAAQARRLGLSGRDGLHECLSPLLQLSQTVAAFDFPRRQPPPQLHHVGPLRGGATARVPLPSAAPTPVRLADNGLMPSSVSADRPFIFASLGTLQGARYRLFRRIARACRRLDAQLLVAHCGGLNPRQTRALQAAGATWVCAFADQQAVLARADAVVSHGGLNTALDAIAAGTPVLALPIAFDQPGVASRVCHAGVGVRGSARLGRTATLARMLDQLLTQSHFAQALDGLGTEVARAGGAPRAADIIEQALP